MGAELRLGDFNFTNVMSVFLVAAFVCSSRLLSEQQKEFITDICIVFCSIFLDRKISKQELFEGLEGENM